ISGVLMLLVVALSAGSIPLKIPAFGTITAAAALPVAGIQGPSVGGYLLVSQFLLSSQTVILALMVLGWWLLRGTRPLNSLNVTGGKSQQPSRARGRIGVALLQRQANLLAQGGREAQRRMGEFLR